MESHQEETQEINGTPPAEAGNSANGNDPVTAPVSVDEHIRRRNAAARNAAKAAREQLLEELGIEDVETYQAERQQAEQARQAEVEAEQTARDQNATLKDELTVLRTKAAELESELQTRRLDAFNQRVDSTILDLASEAVHPEDVALWIRQQAGYGAAVNFEDDSIDAEQLKELVVACKTARPSWFGSGTPGSISNKGAAPRTTTNKKGVLPKANF